MPPKNLPHPEEAGRALARPGVSKDARVLIQEPYGQLRSIQMVFSSVYFSIACSDLSRPKPDCL